MKKLLFIAVLFPLFLGSCGNKKEKITTADIHNPASADGISAKEKEKMPVLTFEKTTHDFGRVMQGEVLSYVFKFKNTGKSNLIISSAKASCGCTTSSPPREPIKPGESGEITVTFNSKSKHGKVSYIVNIAANTYPVSTVLKITADVVTP